MKVKQATCGELSYFFNRDEELVQLALCDEFIEHLHNTKVYPIQPGSFYILVTDENEKEYYAALHLTAITNMCLNAHMYVASKYHDTELVIQAVDSAIKYLYNNTSYTSVIVTPPTSCIHVHKFVEAYGFKLQSVLKSAVKWRGNLEDAHIYQYFLR